MVVMADSIVVKDPCPHCGHERITWDSHYQDYGDYNQILRYQICKSCKERWIVIFKPSHRIVKN